MRDADGRSSEQRRDILVIDRQFAEKRRANRRLCSCRLGDSLKCTWGTLEILGRDVGMGEAWALALGL